MDGGWRAIAVVHSLLTVEIMMSGRHYLNAAIGEWLKADGLYVERRPVQAAMLIGIALLAGLVISWVLRKATTRSQSLAFGATAAGVFLFLVECISLHAIDAILYRTLGPLLLIGWLWLACGWLTVGAAMFDASRPLRLPEDIR